MACLRIGLQPWLVARPIRLGQAARGIDRVPAAHRSRGPDRRLGRGARRGGGRPAPSRVAVRPPGQPFSDRLRPHRPARGARGPRGPRTEDPAMSIPARLGIVTLGVSDLPRSVAFYEALGWERCTSSSQAIAWFRTADSHIGLFPWHELAEDARLPAEPRARFGGITLAINVESPEEVGEASRLPSRPGPRSSSRPSRPTGVAPRATSPTPMATPGRSPTTRSSRSTRMAAFGSPDPCRDATSSACAPGRGTASRRRPRRRAHGGLRPSIRR